MPEATDIKMQWPSARQMLIGYSEPPRDSCDRQEYLDQIEAMDPDVLMTVFDMPTCGRTWGEVWYWSRVADRVNKIRRSTMPPPTPGHLSEQTFAVLKAKNGNTEDDEFNQSQAAKIIRRTTHGYYMCGPTGTGKTTLAACWANERHGRGHRVRWIGWHELVKDEQAMKSFGALRRGEAKDLMTVAEVVPVLVIDDIGQGGWREDTRRTTDEMGMLTGLLDVRTMHKRHTAVTSNLMLDEIGKLAGHVGERLASRLGSLGPVVRLGGNDCRAVF